MISCKTILCPTDLSDTADGAYKTACEVARNQQAHLIVLHITPKGVFGYVDKVSELPTPDAKEKLWEAMRGPRKEESDLDVEHRVEDGDAVEGILRVAKESGCDLIVMSTHHAGRLAHWFNRSTTEVVLRNSPCSVLVVKIPDLATLHQEDVDESTTHAPLPEATPSVLSPPSQ